MLMGLSDNLVSDLPDGDGSDNPAVIFESLKNKFENTSDSNKLVLKHTFANMVMGKGVCMEEHIRQVRDIGNHFKATGVNVTDLDRKLCLYHSVAERFQPIVSALRTQNLSLNDVEAFRVDK